MVIPILFTPGYPPSGHNNNDNNYDSDDDTKETSPYSWADPGFSEAGGGVRINICLHYLIVV